MCEIARISVRKLDEIELKPEWRQNAVVCQSGMPLLRTSLPDRMPQGRDVDFAFG